MGGEQAERRTLGRVRRDGDPDQESAKTAEHHQCGNAQTGTQQTAGLRGKSRISAVDEPEWHSALACSPRSGYRGQIMAVKRCVIGSGPHSRSFFVEHPSIPAQN